MEEDIKCPKCKSKNLEYRGQEYYGDDDDPPNGYASYRCRECGCSFNEEDLDD